MKILVRYQSRSGNTKKLADSIAESVGVKAESIDVPVEDGTDILFLGGALYAGKLNKDLISFLKILTKEKVKRIAVFSTSASGNSILDNVKQQLSDKNIKIDDEDFSSKGKFLFKNKNKPDTEDLNSAASFAQRLISK